MSMSSLARLKLKRRFRFWDNTSPLMELINNLQ